MTYLKTTTSDTQYGNWNNQKQEQDTFKDTWNLKNLNASHGWQIGSMGLTSKIEKEPENKLVIIAVKKIQELKAHLKRVNGKLEALELETTLQKLKENWITEPACPKCGTSTLKQPCDIIEASRNTRKRKLYIEHGKLKSTSFGETPEPGNLEELWNWHQTPIGKQEMNGGMDTKETKTSLSTTFTDGYPGTSYYDSWTDIHLTSMPKEAEDDSWLSEFL